MRNIIISVVLVLFMIFFAIMKTVWQGFVYFAIFLLVALSCYWLIVIIIEYIQEYKRNILSRFKLYSAQLINSTNLTSEDIENNKRYYIKKFNKTLLKEKSIEWLKMLFLLSLIISCIVMVCTGKIH